MTKTDCTKLLILLFVVTSLIATLICPCADRYGLSSTSPSWTRLTYHFFHASILHWLINTTVMISIAFRANVPLWQWLATLAIATVYPSCLEDIPIIGGSIWIYAVLGSITPIVRRPWLFFLQTLFFIFLGIALAWLASVFRFATVAWLAHLYAYFAGVLLGLFTQPIYNI